MICPKCKNQLPDEVKFCKFCGTQFAQSNVQRPAQQRPAQPNLQKPALAKTISIIIASVLLVTSIVCGIIFIPKLFEEKGGDGSKGDVTSAGSLELIEESAEGSPIFCDFEIKNVILDENKDGKKVLIVTYTYSLLKGDPQDFESATNIYYHQNGFGLKESRDDSLAKKYNVDFDADNKEIEVGDTIEVKKMFEISDEKAEIVLEVVEYHSNGEHNVMKIYKIKK